MRPVPLAIDPEIDCSAGADDRGHQSIRRSCNSSANVEPVAVGLGVEMEGDAIAAIVHDRVKLDQSPAVIDVRLSDHASAARRAADLWTDVEPVDPELSNVDV